MNVIHLPTSVGGNAWGLSRGERKHGVHSDVLCAYNRPDWLGYPCDIEIPYYKFLPYSYIKRIGILIKLLNHYDVFHFNFGKTLFDWFGVFDNLELPLLRSKKICVTYNGCDARQKYKTIKRAEICCCKYKDCDNGICENIKRDKVKEKRIKKFQENNAVFFALNPDLMHDLPDETVFLPYTIASWDSIEKLEYSNNKKKTLRIVHAPTDRVIKGSDAVIKAVDRINAKKPNSIELVLVEHMSNWEALLEYSKADIVVDQLRIGWYGAFAVEVMRMGRPVIAYINENDLKFVPSKMARDCKEAIINATEFNLEEVLLKYMENREELEKKRRLQMEYVETWHNPEYVASITKKKYEAM